MTVPLLSPTIFFAVVVSTIYAFQAFGAVDILIGNQNAVRLHTNVLIYNILNTLQIESNPGRPPSWPRCCSSSFWGSRCYSCASWNAG